MSFLHQRSVLSSLDAVLVYLFDLLSLLVAVKDHLVVRVSHYFYWFIYSITYFGHCYKE
jgi:hypothetical protein